MSLLSARVAVAASELSQDKQEIVLAGVDYCPYVCLNDDGSFAQDPGIHIEILRHIFPPSSYEISNVSLPWARAVQQVSAGKYDALNGAFKEDAPGLWFPASPISSSQMCFFKQPLRPWEYKGVDSLKSVQALLVNGMAISREVDGFYQKNSDLAIFIPYERYYENFPKLMQRASNMIFIEDHYVAQRLMRHVWKQVYPSAGCLKAQDMWIPFSPNRLSSKDRLGRFNAGIKKMTERGLIQKISDKYIK